MGGDVPTMPLGFQSMTRVKVLVVDDDLFVRRPLETLLRKEGFDVCSAVDGQDCLNQVAAEAPEIILLDVMMPVRDGFEVCRLLRQDPGLDGVPIILLSARSEQRDQRRGVDAGAQAYLTKPYDPAELLACVRRLLTESTRQPLPSLTNQS